MTINIKFYIFETLQLDFESYIYCGYFSTDDID